MLHSEYMSLADAKPCTLDLLRADHRRCDGFLEYVQTWPMRKGAVFELRGGVYTPMTEWWFPSIGLGVTLWHGEYAGDTATWLRWCDIDGEVIPTGAELAALALTNAEKARQQAERERQQASLALDRAEDAEMRAEQERSRAEQERSRAEQAERRAEELLARLRALGVDAA